MATRELISTPFTASSTADEVLRGVDLTGVRAIVTGASSGIGIETARALTAAGAEVTLAVRNTTAGDAAAEAIAKSTGGIRPRVVRLDLADRTTVTRFVDAWGGPLHLLINNAGVVTGGLERTREGWELQFATNHLGHFALTTGLHNALALGAADRDGARIVSVSSTAHMRSGIDFDDLHFKRRSYDPQTAYAQSKTANILFAVEAYRRWAADGIVVNALHPGAMETNLQNHLPAEFHAGFREMKSSGMLHVKSHQQGAATSLVAAVAPEFANSGGLYLADCNEAGTMANDVPFGPDRDKEVREWALDPASARRLWEVSATLIG